MSKQGAKMNSYDMTRGEFLDEPRTVAKQAVWNEQGYGQGSWLALQLVPFGSEIRRISMPPDLASVSVSEFLAGQP